MKTFIATIAVAALAATAMPFEAQAYCRGCAVGAGVVGGLAAGAIIGSAIANSARAEEPVYAAPPPPPGIAPADVDPNAAYDSAACHVEQQQIWDGQGWRMSSAEVCE